MRIRVITSPNEFSQWRKCVISDVFGDQTEDKMNTLLKADEYFFRQGYKMGDFVAVEAVRAKDNVKLGCGAIVYHAELPSPGNPAGRCGYLMNIYTLPEHRGKGVATNVVNTLIDDAQTRGVDKIYLEAPIDSTKFYSNLNFKQASGMMKLE